MKVAVITGGDSSEVVISMQSATEVFNALDRTLFDPYLVIITGSEWKAEGGESIDKNDFSFTSFQGLHVKFEYALIVIHGTPGENGILQGYFEFMRIPYSGCGVDTSVITFNKTLCKMMVSSVEGVSLSREIVLRRGDKVNPDEYVERLGLPFFVKPNASGSSFGVTKVKERWQIEAAVEAAMRESSVVLLEEYIEGMEVSHGVMLIGGKEYILPVTELVSKNEFFDYEAKYTPGMTDEITPARIDKKMADLLGKVTMDIYKVLDCRGVVRVDYIIRDNRPYFIEVNTIPGMSRGSIVPQQLRVAGLTMQQAYTMIITNKPL